MGQLSRFSTLAFFLSGCGFPFNSNDFELLESPASTEGASEGASDPETGDPTTDDSLGGQGGQASDDATQSTGGTTLVSDGNQGEACLGLCARTAQDDPFLVRQRDVKKALVHFPGCTGTLIHPEWVLSSSECEFSSPVLATSPRSGGQDEIREVSRIINHPQLDVALLRLKSPLLDGVRVEFHSEPAGNLIPSELKNYGYREEEGTSVLYGGSIFPTRTVEHEQSGAEALFDSLTGDESDGTQPGDLGGPSFLGEVLVGVTTGGSDGLTHSVSVSVISSWMLQTMETETRQYDSTFSDANAWTAADQYTTLQYPDINGDGRADVCGRAIGGIWCATSNSDATAFENASLWSTTFKTSDWGHFERYASTIRFVDLNGDGAADLCGRATGGIWCALSDGSSFVDGDYVQVRYSDANGWGERDHYWTIEFPDLDGDGDPDVCGRGGGSIVCAINESGTFGTATDWSTEFGDFNDWNRPEYYETIQFADLNGDGRSDVCGRSQHGVRCALSTGTSFGSAETWTSEFADVHNWLLHEHYSTMQLADVNGDGASDMCGRGELGLVCALSTSTSFEEATLWSTQFQDLDGGNGPQYYTTLTFKDVDGDGRADFCGRGRSGYLCATSIGNQFVNLGYRTRNFNDMFGWNEVDHYTTIQLADIDADGVLEVCGRGFAGIHCAH